MINPVDRIAAHQQVIAGELTGRFFQLLLRNQCTLEVLRGAKIVRTVHQYFSGLARSFLRLTERLRIDIDFKCRTSKKYLLHSSLLALPLLVWLVVSFGCSSGQKKSKQVVTPSYVGLVSCSSCHEAEADLWRGSHHDLAMEEANRGTILGKFEGEQITYAGTTSTFFQRDDAFVVMTDGAAGKLEEFEIAYTLGVDPLQQYLVAFSDGRYQALSLAWDSRSEKDGGQRWIHLYPNDRVDYNDPLHWTRRLQNWNQMCASCHSTGLRKNYLVEEDRYRTEFLEIDVSCEACHGPGSEHVRWAESVEKGDVTTGLATGLLVQLKEGEEGEWVINPATGLAKRDPPRKDAHEIEACAGCHSRRSQMLDDYQHAEAFLDFYQPALLDPTLYYADGQIRDEVYVYGSFLQSKMYREGVSCKDCHDPHTLTVKGAGNNLCAGCHAPEKFDRPAHHRHPEGSLGSECVSCHMPARLYMVVDSRRDHSFRIPRPDLTLSIGTPNACNGCHREETAEWADAAIRNWFDVGPAATFHYGQVLAAGRDSGAGAGQSLRKLAADDLAPGIVRASALSLLAGQSGSDTEASLRAAAQDSDGLIRLGAIRGSEALDPLARYIFLAPLLSDPIRSVRIDSARALVSARAFMTPLQHDAWTRALGEYRRSQWDNADWPESRLNLALLNLDLGELDKAEQEYLAAIRLDPLFTSAYVHLADFYRSLDRDGESEQMLRKALKRVPDGADLHHALGLLLVRDERLSEAVEKLQQAATLEPDEPRYSYVYGVALDSLGERDNALAVLLAAHEHHLGHQEILLALATLSRDAGRCDDAIVYAQKLAELVQDDPSVAHLLRGLKTAC